MIILNNLKETKKNKYCICKSFTNYGNLNWNNDCIFNFYFCKISYLKMNLEVSNFFSFLAAMMLAYQPVRSLATLNIAIQQGFQVLKEFYQLLMIKMKFKTFQMQKN